MNPKKILIISDTHRHCLSLQKVIDRNGPFDMLIHLGDVEGQEDLIEDIAKCPCHIVAGNNDTAPCPWRRKSGSDGIRFF